MGRSLPGVSPRGKAPQGFPYSGQSQLVWLGGKQLAFVDASSPYPLRLSRDRGRTWQAVALPLPPRTETSVPVREGSSPYAVLMLLPNGDLLAATAGTTEFGALWWLLRPRASRWTADAAITAPAVLGRLLAVGSRLYWLKVSSGGPQGILFTGVGSAPLPSSDPVRGHARARPEVTLLSIGAEGPSRQLVTLRGHGFGQKAGELLLLVAHGRPERLAIRSWHETEVTAVVPLRKETLLGEMARGARLLLRTADGARLTVPLRPKFQGDGRGRLRASRPFDR